MLLAACKPDGQEETLVQSIEVTPGTLQLAVGEQGTLSVEYAPEDAVNKSVTWSSSASSVAEVDQDGTVTAIAEGTAVITADCDGIKDQCDVTVTREQVAVESVSVEPAEMELEVGETASITATVLPEDATDKTVAWITSGASVAVELYRG